MNLVAQENKESKTKLSQGGKKRGGGGGRKWKHHVPHMSNIMTNPPDFSKNLHATGNNVLTSLSPPT